MGLDYQKPILGITTKGSVMESDLKKSGHRYFYYGDKNGIKNYLLNLLANDNKCTFDMDYWKQFSVDYAIEKYIKILSNLNLYKA